ncbi:MAG: hypothetical protein AAGE59_16850 [Cyanobacteria bacterium P01_F01_bin.86]
MASPRRASASSRPATPYSLRRSFWVCLGLLFSLGVHGLVLWLPLLPGTPPESTTPEPSDKPQDDASWESLPVAILPSHAPVPSLPEPQEALELAPVQPSPSVSPAAEAPPSPSPTPPPATDDLLPPEEPPPEPPPPEEPPPEEPPPPEDLPPEPAPPEEIPPEEPPPEPSPYADFPHPGGENYACENQANCWLREVEDGWRSDTDDIILDLEAKGFQVDLQTEETGFTIHTVRRDGMIEYYLNVVSVLGGMAYSLTEQPMTANELNLFAQQY